TDSQAPGWMPGSHLDAVPDGGNYDGAAGVVAGLAVVHAMRSAGVVPRADLAVVAFRAEEGSSWFSGPHKSHFGSRAMLGQLSQQELREARSLADGRVLYDILAGAGLNPDKIGLGLPLLDPAGVSAFVELHIEQGPVLVERGLPVGIVSGIRGTLRARNARCEGTYAHSGAVPREYRHDALLAAAELAVALEAQWGDWLAGGRDVVCTLGRFMTDPARHSLTKVPGEVQFTIDVRSEDAALLSQARGFLEQTALAIGARRGVRFALGALDIGSPAQMDAALQDDLRALAATQGIASMTLASGAGHDAANFALAGIPSAMIFVRNDHGSHNRDEAMDPADFALGARLLAAFLIKHA
ncbi:MAG: hydantoinase/carbamoylase family amidase, partial [Burkholderiales bacterium]